MAAALTYTITDLGTLGGTQSSASGINGVGQVVGSANLAGDTIGHPFLWQDGTMIDLGSLPGFPQGGASSINDNGLIVGTVSSNSDERGFVWRSGNMTELAGFSPTDRTIARGLNNSGQAVGRANAGGNMPAVRWDGGTITSLGLLGFSTATANSINDVGQAVGDGLVMINQNPNDIDWHAFIWQNGKMTDLGVSHSESHAYDINSSGQIAGVSSANAFKTLHATVWKNGQATDIGTGPTGDGYCSYAWAINSAGDVVGSTCNGSAAVIWRSGQMVDLNTLIPANAGWKLQNAMKINDRGQIVGTGIKDGKSRGFLLTPTSLQLPSVVALAPVSTQAGGPGFTLTVTGSNFASGAIVRWNGSPRPTTFGSATQLTAQIAASDIAAAGTASVTVVNPGSGAPSNALTFTIGGTSQGLTVSALTVEHQSVSSLVWADALRDGTYDGNPVKVAATIQNTGTAPLRGTVAFYEDNVALPGSGSTYDLPVGQTTIDPYDWDTSGWAWNDDGSPHLTPSAITVVITTDQGQVVSSPRSLKIKPKPVIFVHGYNSNAGMWSQYVNGGFLSHARPDWEGFAVDTMNTSPTLQGRTIAANAQSLRDFIQINRGSLGAWHVDVVAHSLGGLITRQYIQSDMPVAPDKRPVIAHLVMMGTPNNGSFCTMLRAPFWEAFYVGFNGQQTIGPPDIQLMIPYVENIFNRDVYKKNGVEFDNLAGTELPGCDMDPSAALGDVAVRYSSAKAFADRLFVRPNLFHLDMATNPLNFSEFVQPCLAVSRVGRASCGNTPVGALAAMASEPAPSPQVIYANQLQLAANGVTTVPVTVAGGTSLGILIDAPASIDAELLDPSGRSVDRNAAGSARANAPFRVLTAANPTVGRWQVRLRDTDTTATTVGVTAWVVGSPLTLTVATGQPGRDARVQIDATLINGAAPVPGATVRASLTPPTGAPVEIVLLDMGGGSYRGTTAPLPAASYAVAAVATSAGERRGVMTTVDVVPATPTPTYAASVMVSGNGSVVTAPPSGPYAPGTVVTLTATPAPGASFAGWSVDGNTAGATNPLSLTMNADQTVVATFAPVSSPGPSPSPSASPAPSTSPTPLAQLTIAPASGGTISTSPGGPYSVGQQLTLTATPGQGQLFLGWQITGSSVGHAGYGPVASWANPLTLTLTADTTVTPIFAARPAFPDVTPQTTGAVEPIAQLAARGVIHGYEDGTFGPADPTRRSQMAALIVRAMGWTGEAATNPFADRDGVDDELWQAVAILAQRGVAKGYGAGHYGTSGDVLNAQVVSFITRAMVNKGSWQFQPDDGTIYPNIPASSGHRQDLVTYVHYAGAVRGTGSANGNFEGWDQPSSRAWFAFVLWQALDSYFGH